MPASKGKNASHEVRFKTFSLNSPLIKLIIFLLVGDTFWGLPPTSVLARILFAVLVIVGYFLFRKDL